MAEAACVVVAAWPAGTARVAHRPDPFEDDDDDDDDERPIGDPDDDDVGDDDDDDDDDEEPMQLRGRAVRACRDRSPMHRRPH